MSRITPHDEGQLNFYFGGDRLFYRSSMGGQLSAAHAASSDSSGRIIGRPMDWNYIPRRHELVRRGLPASDNEPPPTFVPKHSGGSSGYEIDRGDVLFHARVSRRVSTVAALDPRAHRILSEVYGDRGARWAALSADKRNAEGTIYTPGIGPGSIAALYELTADGRALLDHERSLTAAHHDPKARATEAKAARATKVQLEVHRAALLAAIAEAEQEAVRLAGLYEQAVEVANQAAADHAETLSARAAPLRAAILGERSGAATSTTRRTLAAAKEAVCGPLDALEECRRSIVLLRRSYAHTGAAPALVNPVMDPSVKEAFEAARAANAERDDLLRARVRLRVELEAQDGAHVAEDDPRLPAVPDPVELGTLPVPTLPTLPRQQADHLTNDELLQNALVVQRSRPDALRAARLARAQDAAQKLLQYALGVWLASQPKPAPKGSPAQRAADLARDTEKRKISTATPQPTPAAEGETEPRADLPPAQRPAPTVAFRARPLPEGEQRSIKGHVRPGYGRASAVQAQHTTPEAT